MIEIQTPTQIEDRVARADRSIFELTAHIGITRATWYRWRAANRFPQSKARLYYRMMRRLEEMEKQEAAQ